MIDDELNRILDNHEIWLNTGGNDGVQAVLVNTDLRHKNLESKNLSYACLVGSNLTGVNLTHANLTRTNLSYVHLNGAILSNTNLRAAKLDNASISYADLSYANLEKASLYNTSINTTTFFQTVINGDVTNKAPIIISNLTWPIIITDTYMTIGCQHHTIEKWAKFNDVDISNMHYDADKFWRVWKAPLLTICKAHSLD